MKNIIILMSLISLQFAATAQTSGKTPLRAGREMQAAKVEYIISSGPQDFTRAKYTPSEKRRDIVITGIPATCNALTTVVMNLDLTGSFSFKKHASLEIPFNREVFIEDRLTGKTFNLKAAEAYTFSADEVIAERFVMHVLDKSGAEAALTSR